MGRERKILNALFEEGLTCKGASERGNIFRRKGILEEGSMSNSAYRRRFACLHALERKKRFMPSLKGPEGKAIVYRRGRGGRKS